MDPVILIKYGEIHLKGLNRPFFERRLRQNLQAAANAVGPCEVDLRDDRFYIRGYDPALETRLLRAAGRVFGIVSCCPAVRVEKDLDQIRAAVVAQAQAAPQGTFKIVPRRSDKKFPVDSMALARMAGDWVLQAVPGLKVDVTAPDTQIHLEIRRDGAYVYSREIPAFGGMPTGTSGRAALLLSGGIDSPVAGWLMMKRGVELIAIHFHSPPYTGERAKQKVLDLAGILAGYGGPVPVHIVPFTAVQEHIYEHGPQELMTLLMRRAMMAIAQRIAEKEHCGALVTGESLGQVASQTLDSLRVTDDAVSLPVFRPLITDDKVEIMDKARLIGSYETSILPFEDCCTVFTPRHPATRPKLEAVRQAEAALAMDALLDEAVAQTVVEVATPSREVQP